MNYMVVTLFNPTNNYNIFVYQKSRTEFKIKSQIGHNSYSIDYIWGLYELARTCFCYLINGYSLVTNNLGYSFAYAIHSGDFTELIETEEKTFELAEEPPPLTEETLEPIEDPSVLIRTQNVIDPEKVFPWKLAN